MIKVNWLPYGKATCLFGIVLYTEFDEEVLNHELIHRRQQLEMLVIFAYLWYFIEFIVKLVRYKNIYKAYLETSFEREAYHNQDNPSYLETREAFDFLRYL